MDTKSEQSSIAKKIIIVAAAAPIVLLILLSFCYIGKYEYYSDYFDEYYLSICSFYTTLGFGEESYAILDTYYIAVGVINWFIMLGLIIISLLSLVAILKFKDKPANFVCTICAALSVFFSLLVFIEGLCTVIIGGSSLTTLSYLPFILEVVLLVVYLVLRIKFKSQFVSDENEANSSAYKSLGTLIVCLFFVPFWMYLWIYKTTEYLNRLSDEAKRDPVSKLLLCLFIPFYSIYWTYISAQCIDKLAKEKGINSDLASTCLILSIFIGIVPPILMQQKINEIETIDTLNSTEKQFGNANSENSQPTVDVTEELKRYKELLDMGAITQEEYDAKKTILLNL